MSSNKLDRAVFWLEKGFKLLPCQPGTKWLVGGFGQYLAQITDEGQAAQWWGVGARANMAVMAPDSFYILDFDKISVYALWADACPGAAQSFTESTPRGGRHVFLRGAVPPGVQLVDGAEIKKIVLVAPSDLGGVFYKRISQTEEILETDPTEILSPLSKPGHATPYAMQASATRRAVSNPTSHVNQIKQHFTISHVLETYRPAIKFGGRGDFKSCRCPFSEGHKHGDSKPSFWFNDAKGIWGCRVCNVHGDVINLYARLEVVSVIEAIRRMWAVMA